MTRILKRPLSILLAVLMILSVFAAVPMSASATEVATDTLDLTTHWTKIKTSRRATGFTTDHFSVQPASPSTTVGDAHGWSLDGDYANEEYMTISALNGETITKIDVILDSDGNTPILKANGNEIAYSRSDNTFTFENVNASDIAIYTNSDYSGSSYCTIKTIVVYYSGGAPTTYTVTWKNGDTTLRTDTVDKDAIPAYNGETPVKAEDEQYTYTFTGWTDSSNTFYSKDSDLPAASKDETYTATYSETLRSYTITWKDGDNNTLKSDSVAYGTTPSYTGATPTKTEDDDYTYEFNNTWSPSVASVTGNATYTAQFTAVPKPAPTSGSFDGLTWNIDDEGTLTFSGSGSIPMDAFMENENIKKVIINDSVTEIGAYAFEECPNLTEVEIQNPSVSLSENSHQFCDCVSLTTVTLPEGMTLIPQGMFRDCSALTTVELPSTITTIEDMAFMGSGLQSISVPAGATYDFSSFYSDNLQSVTFRGNSPMTFSGGELTYLSDSATVYIPEGSKYVYSNTTATLYVKDSDNEWAEMELEDAQSDLNDYIENGFSAEEALQRVNDEYEWVGNDAYGVNVTTDGPYTVELNEGETCPPVFGGATIGKYVPSAPEGINYGDDNYIKPDDTVAVSNSDEGKTKFGLNLDNYLNMQMLGIQKKSAIATQGGDDGIRFVTAVNTNLLKGEKIEDYGYIVVKAKEGTSVDKIYENMDKLTYDKVGANNRFTCKGTSNTISGDFGKFDTDTDYKYVTLALTGTGDSTDTIAARFYVKTTDGEYHYADYIDGNNQTHVGMAFTLPIA